MLEQMDITPGQPIPERLKDAPTAALIVRLALIGIQAIRAVEAERRFEQKLALVPSI
jgi:hypothetical protein